MESGIIFSNLNDYVVEKDNICASLTCDKWQYMPYKAGNIEGNLLLAGEMTTPCDVTVRLGLKGWYKIFVSTINMKSTNYFLMRFSGDEGFTGMKSPVRDKKYRWTPTEYAEEFFWKCAKLDGEDIIISKPDKLLQNACTVAWIRCVEMSEEEISAQSDAVRNKCIHAHIDEDPNAEDRHDSREGLLTRVYPLINSDVESCSLEIAFDYDTPIHEKPVTILQRDYMWHKGDCEFQNIKESAYKERVDFLHRNNIKVYAADRMSVTGFTPPYSNPHWCNKRFPKMHPEYHCIMRDKSRVAVCSYAFDEVREYVSDTLSSYMNFGFDGVTLIFTRGLHISFEEPVISRFKEKHPDVNPFELPVKDERLSGIWCEFMTMFMRLLKEKLQKSAGRKIEINIVTDYSPSTSKHFGLDIESWAKEGLIDNVLQSNMEIFEDLEGCLENDGNISLVKYNEKNIIEPIIKRYHETDTKKVLEGAKEYLEICKKYNVGFYAALPWEHTVDYKLYPEIMNELRKIGADKFFSWNTNHTMSDLPELHSMTDGDMCAKDGERGSVKHYRVLSLAGSNMSAFNPNWRG